MKLYMISQEASNSYGVCEFAIVAATDEEIARNMDPETGEMIDWSVMGENGWWCFLPEQVKVIHIGEAAPWVKQGVIC